MLVNENHTIQRAGEDWRATIHTKTGPVIRYYSVISGRPDGGLLMVSQKLRREFGITGTWTPCKNEK